MLLPLVPSAHASVWNPAGFAEKPGAGQACPALDAHCRFCGLPTAGWQEPFHLNSDHADGTPDNLIDACPLCHLCQHLDRPAIAEEAALIWLPELSQAAVVALARGIHLALHAHGEPAHVERGRPLCDDTPLRAAWAAYQALLERAPAAKARLGTASPLDLACALMTLSPQARGRDAALLRGVRLLPLGRLHQGGRDVYPQVLDTWAWAAAHPSAPQPT